MAAICPLQTYSGKLIDVFNLQPEDIDIKDIAHSLSNICRFAGHSKFFYSVAQHTVLGLKLVTEQQKKAWLLHDTAEAYLADIPRPLKQHLPNFKEMERRVLVRIYEHFEVPILDLAAVKSADNLMLATEANTLMNTDTCNWKEFCNGVEPLDFPIRHWTPKKAKELFLAKYEEVFEC